MAESDFTAEQIRATLWGIYERRGRWLDLNHVAEIAGSRDQRVRPNRDESYNLIKHLLDENLTFRRFLARAMTPGSGERWERDTLCGTRREASRLRPETHHYG